jgi:riboflavin biosynthesis pyrimidine reductase
VSYAQSLDGRIATTTGDSRWISCARTLSLAHRLRRDHQVILVGIGTVLRDDPELTCRLSGRSRSPVRVILDSHLRLPADSTIVRTCKTYRTIVYTLSQPLYPEAGAAAVVDVIKGEAKNTGAVADRRKVLQQSGIEIYEVQADDQGRVSVEQVVVDLSNRGFRSIFIEGGAQVITSFLRKGLVNRMVVVTAPVIIGRGVEAIGELGVTTLAQALRPRRSRVRRLGSDRVWELIFDGP